MKILYLHPLGEHPNNRDSFYLKKGIRKIRVEKPATYYSFIPMGIIGAINNLRREGYDVKGINLALKKDLYGFDLESYIKKKDGFEIFLIDIHWYAHMRDAVNTAKLIKRYFPDSKIIAGGMSATIFCKELISLGCFDYIIRGDAEMPLLSIIKSFDKGEIKEKDIPNLVSRDFENKTDYCCLDMDKYDYVDISWMEDSKQYLEMANFWLLIGKGCPFSCKVCDGNNKNYPKIYARNRVISRSPENVVKDIKKLENRVEFINIGHDVTLFDDMLDEISKNYFNVGIYSEFFSIPSKEKVKNLVGSFKAAELVFSVMSGSEKERKEYGKGFSNKELLELIRHINTLDFAGGVIVFFTDYLVSQLGVKELDKAKTAKLAKEIKDIMPFAQIEIMPQLVDPLCVMRQYGVSSSELFKSYF